MENQNNDWRTLLQDDKNFSKREEYNLNNLIKSFEATCLDLDNIQPFEFLSGIYEFTRAFKTVSVALSMAFSDITSKVEIWRELYRDHYKTENTIQEVVITEVTLGFAELNGENNDKLGHKKKTKYYTYVSGARTLVRLSWFMNFMFVLFRNMANSNEAFNISVKKAYDEILAPHHPWLIRKSASLAMGVAPLKKGPAVKVFFGTEEVDEETKKKILYVADLLEKIFIHVDGFLKDKKLDELP